MTLDSISATILAAPAWARVGLSMQDIRMRERAADMIAAAIIDRLEKPVIKEDRDQFGLPL
jgi:hypothetical protein